MKFCQHCGAEIREEAVICVKCGCSVAANTTEVTANDDSISAGFVVLSVLIPLFGIIYWPVNAKKRPRCAKACGIAALISWAVSFVIIMASGAY